MKKCLLVLLNLFACNYLFAQKVEVSVEAYSGLFYYAGNGSASTSTIIQSGTPGHDYTNNPYGSKSAFSYGIGIQAQHVGKSGFITGLQAGYEILRSKVVINDYKSDYYTIYPFYGLGALFPYQVKGSSFLQDQSINLSPYIGYRLQFKKTSIDLLPGVDIAFDLSSYDKGKATLTYPPSTQVEDTYQTNYKRPGAPADVRIKFGGALNYKRVAFTASYAYGLINYDKNMPGDYNVHSELIRFGIAYKLSNSK